jgi:hypothetical protein
MPSIDVEQLAEIVSHAVDEAMASRDARIAALEARPELRYVRPYRNGDSYSAGCLASRNGGLWLCERSTSGIPGTAASGWRLIVKESRAV